MNRLPHPEVSYYLKEYILHLTCRHTRCNCKYYIYIFTYTSYINVLGEEDDESSEPERDPKRGAGRRSGTPSEKRPTSGEKTPVDTDAEQRY